MGGGGRESSAHNAQIHWFLLIDIQRLYPPSQSLSMSQLLTKHSILKSHGLEGFQTQHLKSATGSRLIPESVHFYTLLEMAKKNSAPPSPAFILDCRHRRPHRGREEKKKKVFRTDNKRRARGGACANATLSSFSPINGRKSIVVGTVVHLPGNS